MGPGTGETWAESSESAASPEEVGTRLEVSTSCNTLGKECSISVPPISLSMSGETLLL